MARIRYTQDIMKYISLFESLTGTKLKDCILDEGLLFIVSEGQIGKAIGKSGVNAKRIEALLKKKLRIVEFNPDLKQFIKNMVYPLHVEEINEEDNVVSIKGKDTKTKGLLIGRDRKNIIQLTAIVKRYFDVEDIKVV